MGLFEKDGFSDPLVILKPEASRFSNAGQYIVHLSHRYARNPWLKMVEEMGLVVEPYDSELGSDPNLHVANMFAAGALLGLHVMKRCCPAKIEQKALEVDISKDNHNDDDQSRLSFVADSLVHEGDRGFASVPEELANLIESWEEQITPDIRYQPYFHRGFGVMMRLIDKASDLIEHEKYQAELDIIFRDGLDWDSEFKDLLSPPE